MGLPFVTPVQALQSGNGRSCLALNTILIESFQDSITAKASGNQTNGTQLTAQLNRVSTVATAGDSILLPEARPGAFIVVINDGVANLGVYGQGTDTIDQATSAAGIVQLPESVVRYVCITAGAWRTQSLSTGYDPITGLQTLSFVSGLTANSNNNNTAGTPLTALINEVDTVGGNNYSMLLPTAVAGLQITVINAVAGNNFYVYSKGSDTIGAGNNSLVGGGNTAIFVCAKAGAWFAK